MRTDMVFMQAKYIIDRLRSFVLGWSAVSNMNTARIEHVASVLLNGKILVAGGYNNNLYILNTAELYDPLSENWTNVGNMTTARMSHTASVLSDGKVLVFRGVLSGHVTHYILDIADLYDPSSETWRRTEDMIYPRRSSATVKLLDGKVLVIGGYYQKPLGNAELYYV